MRKKILILVLIIFIFGGFLLGIIIPEDYLVRCEKKGCSCGLNENKEIPCNGCGIADPIFVSGIVNIIKSYNGTEMIICENGENIGSRIEINKNTRLIKANVLLMPVYPLKDFRHFLKGFYRDF